MHKGFILGPLIRALYLGLLSLSISLKSTWTCLGTSSGKEEGANSYRSRQGLLVVKQGICASPPEYEDTRTFSFSFFLSGTGFELRTLHLLDRHSTT
jgi:hypothetical protein